MPRKKKITPEVPVGPETQPEMAPPSEPDNTPETPPPDDQPGQPEENRRIQACTQRLRYNFSKDEIFEKGKTMAHLSSELSDLEEEKKAVASDFKAKIEAKKASISLMGNHINNGYEYREVECEVTMNDPTPGMKTVVRKDTNEVVETIPMESYEMQFKIEFTD